MNTEIKQEKYRLPNLCTNKNAQVHSITVSVWYKIRCSTTIRELGPKRRNGMSEKKLNCMCKVVLVVAVQNSGDK